MHRNKRHAIFRQSLMTAGDASAAATAMSQAERASVLRMQLYAISAILADRPLSA
jgi:hypothetical protein